MGVPVLSANNFCIQKGCANNIQSSRCHLLTPALKGQFQRRMSQHRRYTPVCIHARKLLGLVYSRRHYVTSDCDGNNSLTSDLKSPWLCFFSLGRNIQLNLTQGVFCYLENQFVLSQQEDHIVARHQSSDCFISISVVVRVKPTLISASSRPTVPSEADYFFNLH